MCGADGLAWRVLDAQFGSSPRVRSRLADAIPGASGKRIISACAEQTTSCRTKWAPSPDHLRVCGADRLPYVQVAGRRGSSPRVRSRPQLHDKRLARDGIISACAEQTG